jgi:hypothetical protein
VSAPGYRINSASILYVRDREALADGQCGELIEGIAASTPVRKLLFIEPLGDMRVPFAGHRPDHDGGVESATVDAHRAPETVADLERGLDDGVPRKPRRDRFKIGDFAGRETAGHSVPRSIKGARSADLYAHEADRFHVATGSQASTNGADKRAIVLYVIIVRFLRDRTARPYPAVWGTRSR